MNLIVLREERPGDEAAVREVHTVAFEGPVEARIVDRLREACTDLVSLVAVDDGRIVGHVLFSPATVERGPGGMGLAPLAVLPEYRRRGIGLALVERGLSALRDRGCPFVVVLGHPGYYPRFGVDRASVHGLASQWEGIPDEAFMVLVLDAAAMAGAGGVARYRPEFDEAME
ncbi:MAG: N-acetyltransferase [Methanospirillum sp.]